MMGQENGVPNNESQTGIGIISRFCPGIFLLILMLFMVLPVSALDPSRAITQYKIDLWNDESGLPQNTIRAICQTSDGYLWIGTEEGLVRFNGVNFTVFDENNTPEITNNFILCLFEDSRKNLWIGSRGEGLIVYKKRRFHRYTKKEGFTDSLVSSICEDSQNNIWIGTDGDGLFRFKEDIFSRYSKKNGLSSNVVRGVSCDSTGNVWAACEKGFCYIQNNEFRNYSIKGEAISNRIKCIFEDSRKRLWIGTDKGLKKIENGTIIPVTLSPDSPDIRIYTIFEDSQNNLWIGTTGKGLFRLQNGKFTNLSKKSGLADDTVIAIAEDREGSLWIGTAYAGLNRLRDGKFITLGKHEGLADEIVFAIHEDRAGYMWVGTNNGLNRIKNGENVVFTTKQGLTNNVIDALYEDSQGYIWVGTDDGLNRLKSTEKGIRKVGEYARNNYILAVSGDKAGNIWLGTLRGLVRLNGKNLKWVTKDDGLPSNTVVFIHQDKTGRLWIGTFRAGLTLYSNGKFTLFTREHGLADLSVNCLYEDRDGVLWVGTISGLSRFKNGKFTTFTKKDGLFNNNIYKILEDNTGNLWMSCNKGIFKVSKKTLNHFADNPNGLIPCIAYGKEDGMRSSECNGGYQSAGCKTLDGKLWFPTVKGTVIIDPENIRLNNVLPPVYMETVKLDGVPVSCNDGPVIVKPQVKRVEIDFTALSFLNPKKVLFKFKLEGYEDRWVNSNTNRAAYYTNLDAGDYRFRVIACNNDGLWNKEGAVINFTVIPPYWNTWWFQLIALVGFSLVSYVIIHIIRKYIRLIAFWKKQKIVSSFKLLEKIASGGMGAIYRAESVRDKTEVVAIKLLKDELLEDAKNRKRFKQEAAIVDQLDHPNIVKVFERGQSGHHLFIAMELLEGQTLTEKIHVEEKINLREAIHIMLQVTGALTKIHGKSIVHRDIKPDNIMLITRSGDPNFVKLLDFGLARTEHQTRLTQTGMVVGTIKYMAPELISGETASSATDIYALGILFYELLTREVPFTGDSSIEIMRRIVNDEPPSPTLFRRDLPKALNDLIMAMISKSDAERPNVTDVQLKLTAIFTRLLH